MISDVDSNGKTQLKIEWMKVITRFEFIMCKILIFTIQSIPTSRSGRCSFYGVADYTLIFEGSAGEMVEVKVVSSDDSCMNGSCSTFFSPSMSSPPCRVSITARNAFGRSNIVLDNVCKLATQH